MKFMAIAFLLFSTVGFAKTQKVVCGRDDKDLNESVERFVKEKAPALGYSLSAPSVATTHSSNDNLVTTVCVTVTLQ